MEPRSYRESDAIHENMKADAARRERERRANMTFDEMVMEGLTNEEFRLVRELEKLRTAAARIPDQEFILMKHREKMVRFRERHSQ